MHPSRNPLLTGLSVALVLSLVYAKVFPCPRGLEGLLSVTLLGFCTLGALITGTLALFTAPYREGLRAVRLHLLLVVLLIPLGLLGLPLLYVSRMCA